MAIVKTTALVLRVIDFSETSQIIHALAPDEGLVSGIAKGARRPKNAFQGPFDRLTLCRLIYYEKRSDALSLIKDGELVETYAGVRRALPPWYAALAVGETAGIAARPKNPEIELFAAATRALDHLSYEPDVDWRVVLIDYLARYLAAIGQAPDTARCAATDAPLLRFPHVEWVLREGRAYRPGAGPADVPRMVMDATTLAVLQRFVAGERTPLARLKIPDAILTALGTFLTALTTHTLERPLNSFRHLRF